MSKNKVTLYCDEVENIAKLLQKFPDARRIDIIVEDSSGIGKLTDVVIHEVVVNGVTGELRVTITGVDHW